MDFNELYRNACEGDKRAEEKLFSSLSDRFRLFVNHRIWNDGDREEIVQEALLTVASEYVHIDIETSFVAWAHKVLDFRILSYLKAKKARASHISLSADDYEPVSWDPDPIMKRQLQECLKKVIEIRPKYARILALHYQGFTKDEVRERLDLTVDAYYVLLSRARAQLRACLDESDSIK